MVCAFREKYKIKSEIQNSLEHLRKTCSTRREIKKEYKMLKYEIFGDNCKKYKAQRKNIIKKEKIYKNSDIVIPRLKIGESFFVPLEHWIERRKAYHSNILKKQSQEYSIENHFRSLGEGIRNRATALNYKIHNKRSVEHGKSGVRAYRIQ